MAVIDSCEIPAKHNYNNSAAADQRGIGAPVTNYGSNIIMQLYRSRDKSGEGEGGGERISVVFHLANSRNSPARERGTKPVINARVNSSRRRRCSLCCIVVEDEWLSSDTFFIALFLVG